VGLLEQALQLQPDNELLLFYLAQTYGKHGLTDRAKVGSPERCAASPACRCWAWLLPALFCFARVSSLLLARLLRIRSSAVCARTPCMGLTLS
jgi:hypothetical protein